ncbi:hypothetical protein B0H14DRAFT_2562228 [Mycena olivaceomarginata]|nr:hypothetical protein B0H14DRAFT_2562228 [Mycena olivaceomarginata]
MSSTDGHACGAVLALVLVVSMCAGSTPSATDGGGAGGARVRAREAGADSAESVGGAQAWRRRLRREERGGDEQGSSSMREEIEIGIEKRKDEIWDEHEVPQMSRKVERAENCTQRIGEGKSGRRETYHRGLPRQRPSRLGLVAVAASHICSVGYSVNVSAGTHDSRTGCLPNGDMSMQSASSLPILICTALSRFVTGREGGHPTSRFAGCVQQRRRPPPPLPRRMSKSRSSAATHKHLRLPPSLSLSASLPPHRLVVSFGALRWGEKVHAASNIGDISWTARGRLCVQARNTG